MLRRVATLLRRHPVAPHGGLPRHPSTAPPLPSIRHALAELARAPTVPSLRTGAGGVRSYVRLARRLPPTRPDGYCTSDGEVDEPDPRALEEEDLGPHAGVGEDSEGSDMEGFMLDFGSGSDTDGGDGEDEGVDERDK